MKNSKLRRALLLVACAVLLVSISVSATLAYLTSKTKVVTNTFSVGSVSIDLDENKVTEYGVKDGETLVKSNTYKLVPGHTYLKNPTVHVAKGSEECYLFVKVDNGISDIEADVVITTPGENGTQTTETIGTIEEQMLGEYGWRQLEITKADGTTEEVENVYYYYVKVDAREAAVDKLVFFQFKVDGEADVASCADASINVQAYAVQADGFNSAADAWVAAPCTWGE